MGAEEQGQFFQRCVCIGDSQTTGARSVLSLPTALAAEMHKRTDKCWDCIEEAVNGETVKDVTRRMDPILRRYPNEFIATLLMGTNDCRSDRGQEPPEIFERVYLSALMKLKVRGWQTVVGTIPTIHGGFAHFPYTRRSMELQRSYNEVIRRLATGFDFPVADLSGMPRTMYVDAVHFNDEGCLEVARRFAQAFEEA